MRFLVIGGTGRSGTTVMRRTLVRLPTTFSIDDELRVVSDHGGLVDLFNCLTRGYTHFGASVAYDEVKTLIRESLVDQPTHRWLQARLIRKVFGRVLSPARYSLLRSRMTRRAFDHLVQRLDDTLGVESYRGTWIGGAPYQLRGTINIVPPVRDEDAARIGSKVTEMILEGLGYAPGGAERWVIDDSPYSVLRWREYLRYFPGSKFLLVVRDPLDTTSSYTHQVWAPEDPDQSLKILCHFYEALDCEAFARHASSFVLRFEDIVSGEPEVVQGLSRWLECAPDQLRDILRQTMSVTQAHLGRGRHDRRRSDVPASFIAHMSALGIHLDVAR